MRIFGKNLFWLLPLSFLAGVINGLLGAGGGIVLVFMLSAFLKGREDGAKAAFAVSSAAVLAFSAVSAASYGLDKTLSFCDALPYIPSALIGGILGAFLQKRISLQKLNVIFAAILIFGGFRMLF